MLKAKRVGADLAEAEAGRGADDRNEQRSAVFSVSVLVMPAWPSGLCASGV